MLFFLLISKIIDWLNRATIFSKINIKKGFYTIRIIKGRIVFGWPSRDRTNLA